MSPRPLAVAGIALTVASVAVLAAQWVQWSDVPADADWAAAVSAARRAGSPDSAFVVEPEWESRPRVFMGDAPYVPAQSPTWFDLSPYQRVALVSEAGREQRGAARLPSVWAPDGPVDAHGTVSLQWFRRAADPTVWDVLGALSDARVSRDYGDRQVRCDRYEPGQFPAWHCPRRDKWLYVGETIVPVTNDVHRCLWAMPIDKGGHLRVRFDRVPAGTLSGYLGQTLPAVRSKRGKPVEFEVLAGGERRFHHTLGLRDEGFLPWQAGRIAEGPVEFVVHADNQVDRFFCFAARVESGE